jgi:hypothetical protein
VSAAADDGNSSLKTPVWRIVAGAAVLAVLVLIGILLIPVYLHNFELDRILRTSRISSENAAREFVLERARSLGLDISPNQLQLRRLPGTTTMEVRYTVRVSLSVYTVDLHFASSIPDVR